MKGIMQPKYLVIAAVVLIADYFVARSKSGKIAAANIAAGTRGDLAASGFLGITYPFI